MDACVRGLVTPLSKQQRQRRRHRYKRPRAHPIHLAPTDQPRFQAPLMGYPHVPANSTEARRSQQLRHKDPAAAGNGTSVQGVARFHRPLVVPYRSSPPSAGCKQHHRHRSMAFGKCHGSRPLQVATFSSLTPLASACAGSTGSCRHRLTESSPSLLCFLSGRGRPPEPAASLVAAVRAEEDDASTSTAHIALDHLAGPARYR